jgi:hypothetical protein
MRERNQSIAPAKHKSGDDCGAIIPASGQLWNKFARSREIMQKMRAGPAQIDDKPDSLG